MKSMFGYALVLAALIGAGAASLADRTASSSRRTDAAACDGVWKRGTFVVFDSATNAAVRQTFVVCDLRPEKKLEFEWTPQGESEEGIVSGPGQLIWRRAGASPYDSQAIVSVYRGDMRAGSAEGQGALRARNGVRYEGEWRKGLYHGNGTFQTADGMAYAGSFQGGLFHGQGTLIDATGEVYSGPFVNGRKHGEGKVRLSSGATYQSMWIKGVEDQDSRRVRIAQGLPLRMTPVQFAGDDLRLSLTIDEPTPGILGYDTRREPAGIVVFPDDRKLLNAWTGNGRMLVKDDLMERQIDREFRPIRLIFGVTNATGAPIPITRASLSVERSEIDRQPLFYVNNYDTFCDNKAQYYQPKFTFVNIGWSAPVSAKIEFRFTADPDSSAAPRTASISKPLPQIAQKIVVYDSEPDLARVGANTTELRARRERIADYYNKTFLENNGGPEVAERVRLQTDAFECGDLDDAACLGKIKASGVLGGLAAMARMRNGLLSTHMVGTLTYRWTDGMGASQTRAAPFAAYVPLGARRFPCFGGEGGTPPDADPAAWSVVDLKLEQSNYSLFLPLRRSIGPQERFQLKVLARTDKSSRHRFTLTIEMGNGRIFQSKPINLLAFFPSARPSEIEWVPE